MGVAVSGLCGFEQMIISKGSTVNLRGRGDTSEREGGSQVYYSRKANSKLIALKLATEMSHCHCSMGCAGCFFGLMFLAV